MEQDDEQFQEQVLVMLREIHARLDEITELRGRIEALEAEGKVPGRALSVAYAALGPLVQLAEDVIRHHFGN